MGGPLSIERRFLRQFVLTLSAMDTDPDLWVPCGLSVEATKEKASDAGRALGVCGAQFQPCEATLVGSES